MEKETKNEKTLTGRLELKKTFDAGKIKQSFSHGRTRSVSVEVKKKRSFGKTSVKEIIKNDTLKSEQELIKPISKKAETDSSLADKSEKKVTVQNSEILDKKADKTKNNGQFSSSQNSLKKDVSRNETEKNKKDEISDEKSKKAKNLKLIKVPKKQEERRKGKLTISEALEDNNERVRSLAAIKRAREKAKLRVSQNDEFKETTKEKKKREIVIPEFIAVNELSLRMAERTPDVIKSLMKLGVMATINQTIDGDTAELVAIEFGHTPKRVSEADVEIGLSDKNDSEESLKKRPPVVTIMGHVDHGKTSLLDAIREKRVTQTEAGGITQHIGAYMIDTPKGKITFLDTPGHAAFSQMRARGSNVTDIIVLVVAADDSVNSQTVEAISHAKAAKCPVIVAINKIDLSNANPQKIESDLLSHEIISEKMGGDNVFINVSAKNKTGLDELIEAILLQAEVMELKANFSRKAEGTVIESKVEKGRGPVISVLVQKGKLKVGDIVLAGKEWGKVRALSNDEAVRLDSALPSYPVEILGLSGAPEAGDEFVVVNNESRAREVTQYRDRIKRVRINASLKRGSIEEMISDATSEAVLELSVIIKADVHGSKEAIEQSLVKLDVGGNIKIKILHTGVGEINESDVSLASATSAIILGFNVRTNVLARNLAKRDNVNIKYFSIIYEVIDDVKNLMRGLKEPEFEEKVLGLALIKKVFKVSKSSNIAGCEVIEGVVKNKCNVRVLRDNIVVNKTELSSLRREKTEVKEVFSGQECGIGLLNFNDFKEGDQLEFFSLIKKSEET
tara:strand:+ start:2689 stop:5064 length:2376 start_codon:yes stop_codon:yes gene_type:complete